MQLTSKRIVLITGCTDGGIGSALAQEFNAHGYKVFASARRLDAMSALPPEVTRMVLDVTSHESCRKAVAHVIKECGTLDVLVNNAGIGHIRALLDTPLDSVRLHLETNYVGALRMIQLAAPSMMCKARRGLIINVGSGAGYTHMPFSGAYSASKHALHSMNDILRVELAPLGIDVMLVVPGFTNTPMVASPNANPMSKPSSYGYNACKRSADLFNWVTSSMASRPEALARRVAAAASSAWGPPRHLAAGAGIWWALLEGWLPQWLQDFVHGVMFELWPRGRAAAHMAAARGAVSAAAAARGDAGSRLAAGVGEPGAAVAYEPEQLAAYHNPLFSCAGELSPAPAHSSHGAVKVD